MDHQHVRICRADIVLDDQLFADPGYGCSQAGMFELEETRPVNPFHKCSDKCPIFTPQAVGQRTVNALGGDFG